MFFVIENTWDGIHLFTYIMLPSIFPSLQWELLKGLWRADVQTDNSALALVGSNYKMGWEYGRYTISVSE